MVNNNIPISEWQLNTIAFSDLLGWEVDNHRAAFEAFLTSAKRMVEIPYKTRQLQVRGSALQRAARVALDLDSPSANQARKFFEAEFTPKQIITNDQEDGFLTGFFEPVVSASLNPSKEYPIPLYQRPKELIDIDDASRPVSMDPYFRFGKRGEKGVEEYYDRPAIQSGALEGKNLELVWLRNKVDAFFIHVQGAAKLVLENGEFMRITYAAKSGHPYTSVAKVLCQQTSTAPELMTADRLADWMHKNPDQLDALLAHNQSFIFFKEVIGLNQDEGPIAAAKVPLTANRSLAVDRKIHTFGSPIWVSTMQALPEQKLPLARLMIAHDTGSAIVGASRGDIFTGTGDAAGLIAGRIRHQAKMTILVPNR